MNLLSFFSSSRSERAPASNAFVQPREKDESTLLVAPQKASVRFADEIESVCVVESYKDLPLWWTTHLTGKDVPTAEDENAQPLPLYSNIEAYLELSDGAYKQLKLGQIERQVERSLARFFMESDFRGLESTSTDAVLRYHVKKAEQLAVVDTARMLQHQTGDQTGPDESETLAQYSRHRSSISQQWAHVIAEIDAQVASLLSQQVSNDVPPGDDSSVVASSDAQAEKPMYRAVQRRNIRPMVAL